MGWAHADEKDRRELERSVTRDWASQNLLLTRPAREAVQKHSERAGVPPLHLVETLLAVLEDDVDLKERVHILASSGAYRGRWPVTLKEGT